MTLPLNGQLVLVDDVQANTRRCDLKYFEFQRGQWDSVSDYEACIKNPVSNARDVEFLSKRTCCLVFIGVMF